MKRLWVPSEEPGCPHLGAEVLGVVEELTALGEMVVSAAFLLKS